MDTNHTIDRVIAGYRDQRDAAMAERDALHAQVAELAAALRALIEIDQRARTRVEAEAVAALAVAALAKVRP